MKKVDLFFTAILVPLDYLALIVASILAYNLRFSGWIADIRPVTFNLSFTEYLGFVLPIAVVWILIFALSGLYSVHRNRIAVEFTKVLLACSTGIAVILAIAFFSRELFDSRFIVLAIWFLTIFIVIIERALVNILQRLLRKYKIGMQYVIVIGKTNVGNNLKKYFSLYPSVGYCVVHQFANYTPEIENKILNLKKQGRADVILLANTHAEKKEIHAIKTFSDNEHVSFIYSAEMFPGSALHPILHTLAGHPLVELPKTPLDGWGAIYKRGFDIIGSLFLIIVTLPIQLITVVATYIENPGPVFFVHKRVGQSGKLFKYFKFRSMIKDAHKYRFDPEFIAKHGNMREGTPLFKLENDPRITKVGRVIRKLSIDEIAEFYLVLFGRMSLVGPRPHMEKEVAMYKPSQRRVLTIKPGITGMAQVSGRADISFDEEVQLDVYYIENWSPWLDFIILLKTPFVVLFGHGAY